MRKKQEPKTMFTAQRRFFPNRQKVKNPSVILKVARADNAMFDVQELEGTYWLVKPTCAEEVFALQMLEHRLDKFASGHGESIVLTERAIATLDA
jgi:hypothetical protein